MDFETVRSSCAAAHSRVQLLITILDHVRPRSVCEIGVWKGELAERLLGSCESIERYYMIDPWRPLPDWNKPANVSRDFFREVRSEALRRTAAWSGKRVILDGRTADVIGDVPDGSLDLCYVDGDHTLRGITVDLFAAYPKLRPGGILIGDDFSPTIWQHDVRYEPTLVFPYAVFFAEAIGAPICALPFNQFLIVKPLNGERGFAFDDMTGLYPKPELRTQMSPIRAQLRSALSARCPGAVKSLIRALRGAGSPGLAPRRTAVATAGGERPVLPSAADTEAASGSASPPVKAVADAS